MSVFFIEIAVFILNIWNGIVNRGTIWGWLSTTFIIWQVYSAVKAIKEY